MKLIEQLGGYETLKREYEETLPLIQKGYKSKSMEVIRLALLEYRRQHNIYEGSDKIVFVDDFMHDELMVVAWTRKGEVWMDEGAKRCTDLSMIRHATDAEIKAGKRRPELDSDTCSDIRNHVSPLTKVIDR